MRPLKTRLNRRFRKLLFPFPSKRLKFEGTTSTRFRSATTKSRYWLKLHAVCSVPILSALKGVPSRLKFLLSLSY